MRNKSKLMMDTAKRFAEQSYCNRSKVGAVLEKDGRILVTGYNGTLSGTDNCCEDGYNTKDSVVHAEQNIISFAAKNGIATKGTTIWVTMSPCENCAKLLVQAGVSKVVYGTEYRCNKGITLLQDLGIEVIKYGSNQN